jgi:hypothetical protein
MSKIKETRPNFEHFILTHFNVHLGWSKCLPRPNSIRPVLTEVPGDDWFMHRLDLFEKYCYPSLVGQSCKNFKWMIIFDEKHTNKKLLRRFKRIIPIFINDENYNKFRMYQCFSKEIKKILNPTTEWLLTTRLDCDDALNKDYVKVMHERFSPEDRILNPVNGVIYNIFNRNMTKLDYKNNPNPYITTIEKVTSDELKTCFRTFHPSIRKCFKKYNHITHTSPFWLQIVHDKNLRNKLRGTDVKNVNRQLTNFCIVGK